ncbi:MAG: hypothetical protein AAF902_23880 [Chloroflexota bacterium]
MIWLRRLGQSSVYLVLMLLALSCGPIPIERVAHSNFDQPDSVSIRIGWIGLGPLSPRDAMFDLTPNGSVYDVSASYSAGGHHRSSTFTSEEEFTVSSVDTEIFFDFLRKVNLHKGEYEPFVGWTDDYPEYEIVIRKGRDEIVFYSKSQGPDKSPWQIKINGESYVSDTSLPSQALQHLEPYFFGGSEPAGIECQTILSSQQYILTNKLVPNKNSIDWLMNALDADDDSVFIDGEMEERLKYERYIEIKGNCLENRIMYSKPVNLAKITLEDISYLFILLDTFVPTQNEPVQINRKGILDFKEGHQIIQGVMLGRYDEKHFVDQHVWWSLDSAIALSELPVDEGRVFDSNVELKISEDDTKSVFVTVSLSTITQDAETLSQEFKYVFKDGYLDLVRR